MIKILSAPIGQDLKPLSVYWWQQGLQHRIIEESGEQAVYAAAADCSEQLRGDYQRYSQGELKIELARKGRRSASLLHLLQFWKRFPVTVVMALLSLLGFVVVQLQWQQIVDLLVIQSTDASGLAAILSLPEQISINEYLVHGHYWRLITPIFLHFGWLHIVFNMLWLWELGRRIEVQGGSLHLLSVIFFIGIASNLYQAQSTPLATFGGMSGVIYGLLGYCASFNLISPRKSLQLPREIYILMLVSLLIGYLGLFDFLARMANTAHLSGLILGLLVGFASAMITRICPAQADS